MKEAEWDGRSEQLFNFQTPKSAFELRLTKSIGARAMVGRHFKGGISNEANAGTVRLFSRLCLNRVWTDDPS